MRRWILPITVFASTGLVLSVWGLMTVAQRRTHTSGPDPFRQEDLAVGLEIPPFSLIDQDGKATTEASLLGRVTILDFIFTNCPTVCPGMTLAMSDLNRRLKDSPVRFMSISVDPAHDTPERLREFASGHEIEPSRWELLTGDRPTIERIVRGALQFELQEEPSRRIGLPDGGTMDNIVHPGRLILVGPTLKVIGFYDPNRMDEMEALAARAQAAARGLPSPPRATGP